MTLKGEFEENYKQILNEKYHLPREWEERYRIEFCYKESDHGATFRARDLSGGGRYILKYAYGAESERLEAEAEVTQALNEWDRILCVREGDAVYMLRPYLEGISLAEADRSCFDTEEKMVDTALELTFEVSRLHHYRSKVIHRDIKPENVILRPTGSMDLIDFETVRNYKAGKESDTCCLGTRQTAAPEQFGFGQSDERTDVYGIGKTLLYLWTGDYKLESLKVLHPHSKLNKIIEKCCAFDPDDRYSSVDHLREDLLRYRRKLEKQDMRFQMAMIAFFILFGVVCVLCYHMYEKEKELFDAQKEIRAAKEAQQMSDTADTGELQNYTGRLVISGWDMTDYRDALIEIVRGIPEQHYEKTAEQAQALVQKLYEDDFLKGITPEDPVTHADDEEWLKTYHITRMGYEKVADDLAYRNEFLQSTLPDYAGKADYIGFALRNMLENTDVDEDGEIRYTQLRLLQEGTMDEQNLPYALDEFLQSLTAALEETL